MTPRIGILSISDHHCRELHDTALAMMLKAAFPGEHRGEALMRVWKSDVLT